MHSRMIHSLNGKQSPIPYGKKGQVTVCVMCRNAGLVCSGYSMYNMWAASPQLPSTTHSLLFTQYVNVQWLTLTNFDIISMLTFVL